MVRADALSALARFEEARETANEALATFRRLGAREWEASTLRILGQVEHAAGNLNEAEAILGRAVETASGMPHICSRAAGQLASVLVARGDLESAEAHAKRARAEGTPMAGYEAQLVLAEIALLRNEPGAESLVSEALARMDAGGYLESAARRRLERLGQRAGDPGGHAPMGQRQRRTFMFTDIVGSTKLVEVLGDEAWEHLLRWHDETLRSLFAGHEGEEVNRIGDGFFVAFRESAAAVACSIAIQRRLARHRLEHGFSPEVRIGLHLADATRKEGDYQGKGVHVAARIGALAEGGEILASQPTVAHVDGLALSEARSVVLSGLSKPIDIFAISWR
jgi:class 3 adenylate cyclase